MLSTLRTGFKFSQTWPKKEPYMMMFEQTKALKLTDMAMTVAPAIAFVTAWLQLTYLGFQSLNTALAMSLLIISIPFHGYFLLGKQADEPLPLGLKSWYKEIEQQLKEKQVDLAQVKQGNAAKSNRLTYMDLAKLLKILFERK